MKKNFSEISRIPRGQPLPSEINQTMREAATREPRPGTSRERTFKFRQGVCQSFQVEIEFENPKQAFDAAEERRWYGELKITKDKRTVFILNTTNENVYFDNPKKEKTQ